MITRNPDRLFQAILEPQRPWRGLITWCIAAFAIQALLVAAASFATRPAVHFPNVTRSELVVVLLDPPQPAELAAVSGTGTVPDSANGPGEPRLARHAPNRLAAHPQRRRTAPAKPAAPAEPAFVAAEEPGRGHASNPPASAAAAASRADLPPHAVATTATLGGLDSAPQAVSAGSGVETSSQHSGGAAASSRVGTGSPAAPSGKVSVLPFMDGMTRPTLVSKVDPEYTREARDANVQGLMLATCIITALGTLQRCRIVKGIPAMNDAVLSALSRWRYTPVLYRGKPTAVEYVIPIRIAAP